MCNISKSAVPSRETSKSIFKRHIEELEKEASILRGLQGSINFESLTEEEDIALQSMLWTRWHRRQD